MHSTQSIFSYYKHAINDQTNTVKYNNTKQSSIFKVKFQIPFRKRKPLQFLRS